MKTMFILSLVIVSLVAVCGCSNIIVHVPDPTPVPTPAKESSIVVSIEGETPTEEVTTIITTPAVRTPTPAPTPTPTTAMPTRRTPKPTPTVIQTANITNPYVKYSDLDFKVSYPSNWTVEYSTIPYEPSEMIDRNTFHPRSRQVIFHGDNKTINFTVVISDLDAPGTGSYAYPGTGSFQNDITTCANTVTARFPDVGGVSLIDHYAIKYTNEYHTPYVQFTVTLPATADEAPLQYIERDLLSYHHFYTIRFNTPGILNKYTNVADTMFSSLETEEKSMTPDWIP